MTTEEGVGRREKTADEVVGRVFEATLGAMDMLSVYLGDRLGLYRALRDGGPATAARTRDARRDRSALRPRVAGAAGRHRLLEVEDVSAAGDERRYSLPEAYAASLLDPDSPLAAGAMALSIGRARRRDAAAPRGVPDGRRRRVVRLRHRDDRGPGRLQPAVARRRLRAPRCCRPSRASRSAWSLTRRRASRMSPVASAGRASRSRGRTRACASTASISTSRPIELANQNARDAGVDDRVTFRVLDVADAEAGAYDLAVIIEGVHDMTQPVGVLASVRRMLQPDGVAAGRRREDRGRLHRARLRHRALLLRLQHPDLPARRHDRATDRGDRYGRCAPTRCRGSAPRRVPGVERLDEPALETLRFYRMTP